MSNLASTFSDLGRHKDALAMKEKVLEFRCRLLPESHPSIGEGGVYYGIACFTMCLIVTLGFWLMCRYGHEQPCRDVF
jgi:hypothetical protein